MSHEEEGRGQIREAKASVDPDAGPEVASINCKEAAREPREMRRAKRPSDCQCRHLR